MKERAWTRMRAEVNSDRHVHGSEVPPCATATALSAPTSTLDLIIALTLVITLAIIIILAIIVALAITSHQASSPIIVIIVCWVYHTSHYHRAAVLLGWKAVGRGVVG